MASTAPKFGNKAINTALSGNTTQNNGLGSTAIELRLPCRRSLADPPLPLFSAQKSFPTQHFDRQTSSANETCGRKIGTTGDGIRAVTAEPWC